MKPIQVYLSANEHRELKLRAAREGTTISELVRRTMTTQTTPPVVVDVSALGEQPEPLGEKIDPVYEGYKQLRDNHRGKAPELSSNLKLCKNGHILGQNGRCLQKDCKFS